MSEQQQIVYLNLFQGAFRKNYQQRAMLQTYLIARELASNRGGWVELDLLLSELSLRVGIGEKTALRWIRFYTADWKRDKPNRLENSCGLDFSFSFHSKKYDDSIRTEHIRRGIGVKVHVRSMYSIIKFNASAFKGNYASFFSPKDYNVKPADFAALCYSIHIEIFLHKQEVKNKSKSYVSLLHKAWFERIKSYDDHCYVNPKWKGRVAHKIGMALTNKSLSQCSRLKWRAAAMGYLGVDQQFEGELLPYKTREEKGKAMRRAAVLNRKIERVHFHERLGHWIYFYPCKYESRRTIFSHTKSKNKCINIISDREIRDWSCLPKYTKEQLFQVTRRYGILPPNLFLFDSHLSSL